MKDKQVTIKFMTYVYIGMILSMASINTAYGQKQDYISNFTSAEQLRKYYYDNITLLEPIEGEYDVTLTYKTNSPNNPDGFLNYVYFLVKNPITKRLYVYSDYNSNKKFEMLKSKVIEPVGSNEFIIYWSKSSWGMATLENIMRLTSKFVLSPEDTKKLIGNSQYKIHVEYVMNKKYPTMDIYAKAQPKEWTGTGFALKNNYIATNNHVIEGAKSISVIGINGDFNHKYSAEVVAKDKHNDLAIIKVNGINISSASIPYLVKTGTSEVGEEVFVLGYPLTSTMGEEIKLTTGVISSKTGFQGDVSIYQISAPIQPGNSGGPLFDSKGNVIGIVSSKHMGAENVGYAIKTSYLRNLMESAISFNILPQNNKVSGLKLSEKVKSVKNFVYYITCSNIANSTSTNESIKGMNTLSRESSSNSNYTKAMGFRVQVFKGGNSREDRLAAERISEEIKSLFKDEAVYCHYYSPNWVCRIGNYRTYEEAYSMKMRLNDLGYKDVVIMKGKITVKVEP